MAGARYRKAPGQVALLSAVKKSIPFVALR